MSRWLDRLCAGLVVRYGTLLLALVVGVGVLLVALWWWGG
jgi:hypothetical protein